MSQSAFAELLGESMPRVSNLEYQRTNIGDDILRRYQEILTENKAERDRLAELAKLSNGRRFFVAKDAAHDRLHMVVYTYGNLLSDEAIEKINAIIDDEIGDAIAEKTGDRPNALRLETTMTRSTGQRKRARKRREKGASVSADSFFSIALLAEEMRSKCCGLSDRLDILRFLEGEELEAKTLCFDIVASMPSFADGAFACIVGDGEINRIIVQSRFVRLVERGGGYARHVLAHEYGHHLLHSEFLSGGGPSFLPPQELARIDPDLEYSSVGANQIVENSVEAEAECFATLLLVPWQRLLGTTSTRELAWQYKEEDSRIEKHRRYLRIPPVRARFEAELARRSKD